MEYDFIDKYNELVETLSKMIRADKLFQIQQLLGAP